MARAYYNEIDPYAAQWLRNLIAAGHIAPGDVDERSIEDVRADDLVGYTQCHFFAGIGVWSYALRRAGWPDEREVWTGSCPCQPFSDAGAGAGFADSRHLWPVWANLIRERRPLSIFGEQVASRDGLAWFDFVHADLEAAAYAVGCTDLCAAGFGAPHIRQRLFFVADADGGHARAERIQRGGQHGLEPQDGRTVLVADAAHADGRTRERGAQAGARAHELGRLGSAGGRADGGVADAAGAERRPLDGACAASGRDALPQRQKGAGGSECGRAARELGDTGIARGGRDTGAVPRAQGEAERRVRCVADEPLAAGAAHDVGDAERARLSPRERTQLPGAQQLDEGRAAEQPGRAPRPVNGFWSDAEWLPCIDGKARPVEPGTFPLAHGAAARVGRLRAYGNAINAEVARHFIEASMTAIAAGRG